MLAVRPVSLNVVPVGVATWVPLRNTLYPVTPTLSVEAVQLRLTWVPDTGVAVRPVGTLGGVVSGVPGSARNATSCITQPLLSWVAVAVYEPVVVTARSWVRLPKAVERVV